MITKLAPDILRQHKGVSFAGVSTAFLCHDGKGNIFLGKRSKNTRDEQGRWDVGGGGLKWGSSVEDNLRRELKEEYDAEPKSLEFLGYFDAFRTLDDGTPTHWLALYFAVLVDPKKIKNNEPDMLDEVGWFTLDTLPSPMHSMWEPFAAKFQDQLARILQT